MATSYSPKIITDGLAFMYDTGSGKSYKGEPTINYIHGENAVAKDSYTTYSATSSGTYNAKHPNAIVAYNAAGTQLSGYYNGGVSDATNTYHAHWQYDPILKKPVVVMNDLISGQWKAKSFGTGLGSWNSQSKSHGDTYTISWLQWVDNLSKNAKAGLYTKNTSGGNGFHDGQANSASSYNTTLYTWQRVYQTYTTSTARDLSQTLASIYMYGHYNVRATVKVADVQFTWGSHPVQFSAEYERSATQGLLDLTDTATIDLSNTSFDSDAQMTFDGTDDYITLGSNSTLQAIGSNATIECWFKSSNTSSKFALMVGWGEGNSYYSSFGIGNWFSLWPDESIHVGVNSAAVVYAERDGSAKYHDGNWHHVVGLIGQNNHKIFVDGSEVSVSFAYGSDSVSTSNIFGFSSGTEVFIGARPYGSGSGHFQGDLPSVKIYNRLLTAAEVLQNYNATKGRFS